MKTWGTHQSALRAITQFFDSAEIGVLVTKNGTIDWCNRCGAEIFEYENPGQLIGLAEAALIPGAMRLADTCRHTKQLRDVSVGISSDSEMLRKDGSHVWCRVYDQPLGTDPTDQSAVWIFEDITEAKKAEEELKNSFREMEAIMRNASVGVLITRNRTMFRYNANFAEMFQLSGENGIGRPARELYRNDDEYASLGIKAAPLLGSGQPFQTEMWMQRQDGSDLWVNLIGYVENPEHPADGTIWILEDRTSFRRAEDALKEAHDELQVILDHSVVGIAFVKNGVFVRCNHRLEEIYGYGPGELVGRTTRTTFPCDHCRRTPGGKACAALACGKSFAAEEIHQRRNGDPFWVRVTARAIDHNNQQAGSIWNFEDISDRKIAEEALRESATLQRAILDSANLIILAIDHDGHIVTCNPATESILGWSSGDLVGRLPTDVLIDPDVIRMRRVAVTKELGYEPPDAIDLLVAHARRGLVEESEWLFLRRDGAALPVQLSVSPLREQTGRVTGFLLVGADITERVAAERALKKSYDQLEERVRERTAELEAETVERRRAEQRLKYLAHHDSLTGLPNRTLLSRRLDEAIENSAAQGLIAAVMFVDIDRFKNINDSLGHHTGDALLKDISRRISGVLNAGDTVARIGGDEFVVVLPCLEQPLHAEQIAEKIHSSLQGAFHVAGQELFATPSVGFCLYPQDGVSGDTLLRLADTAMYAAKSAGRNGIRRFDKAMTARAEQHFQIELALRRALDRNELVPYFQPWIDLKHNALAGMEVLVRWQHPELGLVSPASFISIAEESGLIVPLGAVVLRAACMQLRSWDTEGVRVPALAVNLSPLQFRDAKLVDTITAILEETGIDAPRIELEITETAIMQDGEIALATLRKLKDAGFRLSVDDFGTGYSSLSYLKRFPVDKLKIDRSFVVDMTNNANDAAIVRTIVGLASSLHLAVTAEGVETTLQRDALREMLCDFAQGFFYCPPQPADKMGLLTNVVH